MLDIKFVRENPDVVKENIRKKFQDQKIPMVDEVIALDQENRNIKQEVESLRANKNKISKQIGALMAQGKKEEAEEVKKEVAASGAKIDELSAREKEVEEKIKTIMMTIPNIIDPSVPVGKDDSENVEIERFGEPVVPEYEVAYHAEIMESFDGLDLDSARKDGAELSEENFDKILKSGYVAENYRKMELDEKKGFDSLYFMELKISADELKTQVAKMMQDPECGGIFRVKGFVKDDAGSWMQLNATGHEISMKPIGDGQEVVIVIGEQLKEDCIRKYLEN